MLYSLFALSYRLSASGVKQREVPTYDFRIKTMLGSSLPPVICMRVDVSCICLCIVVFNTCCVFVCLLVASFSGLSPRYSLTFVKAFIFQT